jgi:hypothetical protein
MAQLVGSSCAVCKQRIDSILEGRFCTVCGNPHHDGCRPQERADLAPGRCVTCGGETTSPAAIRFRCEQERAKPQPPKKLNWKQYWNGICLSGILVLILGALRDRDAPPERRFRSGAFALVCGIVFVAGYFVIDYLEKRRNRPQIPQDDSGEQPK